MKTLFSIVTVAAFAALPALAQEAGQVVDGISFGDDSGDYANDRECDDRRFTGPAMATVLGWPLVGRDASDCIAAYQSGQVTLWVMGDALAKTQCEAINFGSDDGEFPLDDECDDPRFEGPATAFGMSISNLGQDATDCSRACTFGTIALRDY